MRGFFDPSTGLVLPIPAGGGGGSAVSPENGFNILDFMVYPAVVADVGPFAFRPTANGAGASNNGLQPDTGKELGGIKSVCGQGSANNRAGFYSAWWGGGGTAAMIYFETDAVHSLTFRSRINSLGTISTDERRDNMGFGDSPTQVEHVNGAYFEHETGTANWLAVTANGGFRTLTDTGIPVVAGQTYLFKIVAENDDGLKVKFYIDDVLVATNDTNLPDNNANATSLTWKTVRLNATSTNFELDTIGYINYELSAPSRFL